MLKSSPLIATVGLSLTIPLAMLGDIARGSHSGGLQADAGSVMVLVSAPATR
jgi:solute carrier family 35 protein F5